MFETTTAEGEVLDRSQADLPVIIQAPQLDINTVAAGGGSRLFYRHGMFVVGPEVRHREIIALTYDSLPQHTLDRLVTVKAVLLL